MKMSQLWPSYSRRDLLLVVLPAVLIVGAVLAFALQHLEPAPPNHLAISTGDDQSDLQEVAEQYQSILKQDGVRLDNLPSAGPFENLKRLQDETSGVDAAFVQDGLGSPEVETDVVSLGSLYYEPVWIFYRGKKVLTHFSQLEGKRISVGRVGRASGVIAQRFLKLNGVDPSDAKLINMAPAEALEALKSGKVDAGVFMLPPDNPVIHQLALEKDLRLMNVAQAEAISRRDPAFHHLVLPRGALDLNADVPSEEINIVASTATLLVRDDLHPALAFLLLKAATQVHESPGILERRGEFPVNKDDSFSVSDDAVQYYKKGGPFWQRYLPYWLAAWVDRFFLLVIPVLALIIPMIKLIPQAYRWRLRSKIYQRYGELKYLEMQIGNRISIEEGRKHLEHLDLIEDRVNKMKMPKNFAEYIYSLKGHIQFVRDRLTKSVVG